MAEGLFIKHTGEVSEKTKLSCFSNVVNNLRNGDLAENSLSNIKVESPFQMCTPLTEHLGCFSGKFVTANSLGRIQEHLRITFSMLT